MFDGCSDVWLACAGGGGCSGSVPGVATEEGGGGGAPEACLAAWSADAMASAKSNCSVPAGGACVRVCVCVCKCECECV